MTSYTQADARNYLAILVLRNSLDTCERKQLLCLIPISSSMAPTGVVTANAARNFWENSASTTILSTSKRIGKARLSYRSSKMEDLQSRQSYLKMVQPLLSHQMQNWP